MNCRSILVHIDAGPGCNRRLRLAQDIADRFDASLIGLGAETWETSIALSEPLALAAARDQSAAELTAAESHFRRQTAGRSNAEWLVNQGFPDRMLALHARVADLIVASRPGRDDSHAHVPKLSSLVIEAGVPVLVAADGGATFRGDSVVVAWKDSRESRRAVADALPFLKLARKVVVVAIDSDVSSPAQPSTALTEVAQKLARHGVHASTEWAPKGHGSVTEAIEDAAGRHAADLIVAGAYGRSHLQEWWLGGVTEDLVMSCSKFVLLSHLPATRPIGGITARVATMPDGTSTQGLFRPKLATILTEGYDLRAFRQDVVAALTVAVVALPLSMAIAVASGVSPARGLYTAIIGGFVVSALGGSRFQIGGPAGAFIVLVAATAGRFGVDGLLLTVFMSGLMLAALGATRLGSLIRHMPHAVTVGFTGGIAVTILASQLKDFGGLTLHGVEPGPLPAKVVALAAAIDRTWNWSRRGSPIWPRRSSAGSVSPEPLRERRPT